MVFVVRCPSCQKNKRIPEGRQGFRCCGVEFEIKAHMIGQSIKRENRGGFRARPKETLIPFEEPEERCINCNRPVSENCSC